MSKHVTILYFFVAAIYSLGFWGVEAYLQSAGFPESTIAIMACSHNLISTLICSYVFLKTCKKPMAIIWVIGFLIVGMADIFHGVLNWVYFVGPFNIINNLSGELYVIYSILLLIAIYKSYQPPISRVETILCLLIATLYFTTLILKIGIPFYKTEFSLYFKVTDTLYNLFTTGIVTLLIISGLRTLTTAGLVFVSSYLLIFCSDLAIRYFDYIKTAPTLTIFNYGWEFGFSLIAATLSWIYLGKKKIAPLFDKLPLNSLRFQVASLSFAVILIFMFALRLLSIPYTFWQNADISVILTIFLITWTAANSAALWLNKKLLSLKEMIIESESKNIPLQYEISEIVDIYRSKNRQLQEANNIIEVQKKSIEMTSKQIAHDIRKPLASMKAILDILPNIHNDSVMLNKMTSAVDRNIAQASDMLSEMLEFSKIDMSLALNNHNPQSIVIAALGDVLRGKEDLDICIEYDLKHTNYLNVDGNRIIRVLTNIIGNAVEAIEGRGKIWIKSEDIHPFMRITIGNNGPVIPEDVQKRLFDPFFTKGKKGGTGLGLSICQKIVNMHGGRISVSSMPDTTEFIIELPASEGNLPVNKAELIHHSNEMKTFRDEEAAREEYGDSANTREFLRLHKEYGRAFYLLIVDDEPLFRETVQSLLRTMSEVRDHVKIVESGNAEEALALFKECEFDYVIADIDMGSKCMNGYEMTLQILEKCPNTCVLIHSNKRRDEMDKGIREIKSPHFMGFLPKPMKQSELLQFLACKTFEVPLIRKEEIGEKKTVLFVNDDESMLFTMKFILKSLTGKVFTAGTVAEAKEKLAENKIDMILSDVNLGENEPSGYDLLKHVRENDKDKPFYILSGYGRKEEEPKAIALGATGYMQLPIGAEELKEVLQ